MTRCRVENRGRVDDLRRSPTVAFARDSSKPKRSPDGVDGTVDRVFYRRGRACTQACSEFHGLPRQHPDPTHFGRITRVADADHVDTFLQLLRDPSAGI